MGLKSTKGALIAQVQAHSPASNAGIKPEDVILGINGERIEDPRELVGKIAALGPGKTADLLYWRDGSEKIASVKLGTIPEETFKGFGLTLAPASSLQGVGNQGTIVADIDPAGIAAQKGLGVGDVILEVGGHAVNNLADVSAALAEAKKENRKAVLLRVKSGEHTYLVAIDFAAIEQAQQQQAQQKAAQGIEHEPLAGDQDKLPPCDERATNLDAYTIASQFYKHAKPDMNPLDDQSQDVQRLWRQKADQWITSCSKQIEQANREAERAFDTQKGQQLFDELIRVTRESGYKTITRDDFLLDAKQLALSGKKIAILNGVYSWSDGVEWLSGIPLVTQDAPRTLRAFLLKTWEDIPQGGLFFQKEHNIRGLALLGHAGDCSWQTEPGATKEAICLLVENGWSVRMPETQDTYTFIPPEWQN
jgi:PDZ domain